jgi:hypothetical protein
LSIGLRLAQRFGLERYFRLVCVCVLCCSLSHYCFAHFIQVFLPSTKTTTFSYGDSNLALLPLPAREDPFPPPLGRPNHLPSHRVRVFLSVTTIISEALRMIPPTRPTYNLTDILFYTHLLLRGSFLNTRRERSSRTTRISEGDLKKATAQRLSVRPWPESTFDG